MKPNCRPIEAVASRSERSSVRSRSPRAGSVTPNTARTITSSVIACIRGCTANASPTGQPATSRSTTSRAVAS